MSLLEKIGDKGAELFFHKNLVHYRAYIKETMMFSKVAATKPSSVGLSCGVILMDLARHGTLIDWIMRVHRSGRRHLPDPVARRVLMDMIAGLSQLLKYGLSHRDLKGDNVFLDCQGRFVIGDLGHVKIIEQLLGTNGTSSKCLNEKGD